MSFSVFPCFIMNFIAVIWPVHFRRPLYTCRQHTIKHQGVAAAELPCCGAKTDGNN